MLQTMLDEDETLEVEENETVIDDKQHSLLVDKICNIAGYSGRGNRRTIPGKQALPVNFDSEKGKVKLSELVRPLQSTTPHDNITRQISQLASRNEIIDKPLEKHEQLKVDRSIAYEQTAKEFSKWHDIIQVNRRAEQLQFPLQSTKLQIVSARSNYTPRTPLEMEIQALLKGSCVETDQQYRRLTREEHLARRAMNLEEARNRLTELRQHRLQISYKTAKESRIKKIKSKGFRRQKRRQELKEELAGLEKMKNEDPEAFMEKIHQAEKARLIERVTLRHRKSSKFAKKTRIFAKYDVEARDSIKEMLEKKRDLKKPQIVQQDDSSASDSESDVENDLDMVDRPSDTMTNPWMKATKLKVKKFDKQPVTHKIKIKSQEQIDLENTSQVDDEGYDNDSEMLEGMVEVDSVSGNMSGSGGKELGCTENEMNSTGNITDDTENVVYSTEKTTVTIEETTVTTDEATVTTEEATVTTDGATVTTDEVVDDNETTVDDSTEDLKLSGVKRDKVDKKSVAGKKLKRKVVDSNKVDKMDITVSVNKKKKKNNEITDVGSNTNVDKKSKNISNTKKGLKKGDCVTDGGSKTEKKTSKSDGKVDKKKKKVSEMDEKDSKQDCSQSKGIEENIDQLFENFEKKLMKKGDEEMNEKVKRLRENNVEYKEHRTMSGDRGNQKVESKRTQQNDRCKITVKNDTKTQDKREQEPEPFVNPEDVLILEHKIQKSFEMPDGIQGEFDDEVGMDIEEAFADDDVVDDFKKQKEGFIDKHKVKDIDLYLPGWGSWGGTSIPVQPCIKKRFKIKAPIKKRRDSQLGHVIINENKDKAVAIHQVKRVPYPFTSRAQFEKSIETPIGTTWNPETSFKLLTKPKVITKMGYIIEPIDKKKVFSQTKTNDDMVLGNDDDDDVYIDE